MNISTDINRQVRSSCATCCDDIAATACAVKTCWFAWPVDMMQSCPPMPPIKTVVSQSWRAVLARFDDAAMTLWEFRPEVQHWQHYQARRVV